MEQKDKPRTAIKKDAQYKENLRVLSTTTPEQLVKSVVKGYGFARKTPKK